MQTQGIIYRPNGHKVGLSVFDKAHKKAVEEVEKDKEIETGKIDRIVDGVSRQLYRLAAVFPFDLFPDQLIIDESKITFIFKDFFWVERVQSIYLKDISDCIVQVSFFFASISIVDLGFRDNWLNINFLKKDEALRARRIIQGLMVARKLDLEIEQLPHHELLAKMEELGKANSIDPNN